MPAIWFCFASRSRFMLRFLGKQHAYPAIQLGDETASAALLTPKYLPAEPIGKRSILLAFR
jgi:hypothetical protein